MVLVTDGGVQEACARLEASAGPSVGAAGIGLLDGDTAISHHSFKAALHAAGAVIDAVRGRRICLPDDQ
eukprot:9026397-Pyramimonas_sp.AAC.1